MTGGLWRVPVLMLYSGKSVLRLTSTRLESRRLGRSSALRHSRLDYPVNGLEAIYHKHPPCLLRSSLMVTSKRHLSHNDGSHELYQTSNVNVAEDRSSEKEQISCSVRMCPNSNATMMPHSTEYFPRMSIVQAPICLMP
nr:hypothetical protein CFP56_50953 [Quercus suber]